MLKLMNGKKQKNYYKLKKRNYESKRIFRTI